MTQYSWRQYLSSSSWASNQIEPCLQTWPDPSPRPIPVCTVSRHLIPKDHPEIVNFLLHSKHGCLCYHHPSIMSLYFNFRTLWSLTNNRGSSGGKDYWLLPRDRDRLQERNPIQEFVKLTSFFQINYCLLPEFLLPQLSILGGLLHDNGRPLLLRLWTPVVTSS